MPNPPNEIRELIEELCSAAVAYGERDTKDAENSYYAAKAHLIGAARAIVAASPCAAQPNMRAVPWSFFVDMDSYLRHIECFGSEDGKAVAEGIRKIGRAWLSDAAAQGGQQPVAHLYVSMERHDMGQSLAPNPPFKMAIARAKTVAEELPLGEYDLYTSPAAPAAPLTEEQIDAIAHNQDDGEWLVHQITKLEWRQFARDIEAAHGITLAGTAGTKKESEHG